MHMTIPHALMLNGLHYTLVSINHETILSNLMKVMTQ